MENSSITLREGLEKFYLENEGYLSHHGGEVSSDAKSFFKSHDVAHVLFDCDISLLGEGTVKIWTIFGTTLGFWNHLKAYKEANAVGLAQAFKFPDYIVDSFRFLLLIPSIIFRAKKMSKAWPWSEFDRYMDVPIVKIREEFKIRTLKGHWTVRD